jgi:hypothetical protein
MDEDRRLAICRTLAMARAVFKVAIASALGQQLRSLLADLATVTRNIMAMALNPTATRPPRFAYCNYNIMRGPLSKSVLRHN